MYIQSCRPLVFLALLVALSGPSIARASGASVVSAGRLHACAVTPEGGAKCWGANGSGQLGDGSQDTAEHPVDVLVTPAGPPLTGVRTVAAGGGHTCALMLAGTVKCWGLNASGQLGDGTILNRSTPVDVPGLVGVAAIATGNGHTCAVRGGSGGTVTCWGRNGFGQLGNGTTTTNPTSSPTDVGGISHVVAITAGNAHTCTLSLGGGVLCWGQNNTGQVGVDSGACGGVGYCSTPRSVACSDEDCPVGLLRNVMVADAPTLSAGEHHTCVRTVEGQVKCWGRNDRQQLGTDSSDTCSGVACLRYAHRIDGLDGILSVTAGIAHSCAVTTQGRTYCWGDNTNGQLGDDQSCGGSCADPVLVCADETCTASLTGTDAVTAGGRSVCARTQQGGVKCWGDNTSGQLGDDHACGTTCPTPTTVSIGTIPTDPWHDLAAHWAPVIYQDTDDGDPDADFITNFDFDGNFVGRDNWNHQPSAPLKAFVYYWVVESPTHWFIGYAFFHPRDWAEAAGGPDCLFGLDCHENDMEAILLTIQRDDSPFGRFQLMGTVCHNEVVWYHDTDSPASQNIQMVSGDYGVGTETFEGFLICGQDDPDVAFSNGHPIVYLEPKGHPARGGKRWENDPGDPFPGGDGVIYHYAGIAEQPDMVSCCDSAPEIGYDLRSVQELWARRCEYGDDAPFARFGKFRGDDHQHDAAGAPWAWPWGGPLDLEKPTFFLDPARVIGIAFTGLGAFSYDESAASFAPFPDTTATVPDCDADNYVDEPGFGDGPVDNCPRESNPHQENFDCVNGGPGCADGGDVCDQCPADATNSCDPDGSAGGTIGPEGGSVATPDGSIAVAIPPGTLSEPTSISVTGGGASSRFGVGDSSTLTHLAELHPEGKTFSPPVTLTFHWTDDITIDESDLVVFQNGLPITDRCADQPCTSVACCDQLNNLWTVAVSHFSEYAVGLDLCTSPATAKLTITNVLAPGGDDGLSLSGSFTVDGALTPALDPVQHGIALRLLDASGVVSYTRIPAGAYDPAYKRGWKVNGARTKWTYMDKAGQAANGITKARIADLSKKAPGRGAFSVTGKSGSYPLGTTAEVDVILPPTWSCFAASFGAAPPATPSCLLAGRTLKCR